MTEYIGALEAEFKNHENKNNAAKQKAYMRDQFSFYGLTAGERRDLTKPFLVKEFLPNNEDRKNLITILWDKPEREYQMFALDLYLKYLKKLDKSDLNLIKHLITHKSWWDTVDIVSYKILGQYFKLFPEEKDEYIKTSLNSGNFWLQRSTLLFQLNYKSDLDTDLLRHCILHLIDSKEFFIRKAIGWVLRQYSITNPEWVVNFVKENNISPLSEKEALRLIKSGRVKYSLD